MVKSSSQSSPNGTNDQLEGNTILLAILALLVDERERAAKEDPSMSKTEVILDSMGLSHQQIAKMLNKNSAAVRMSVTRAKARSNKKANNLLSEE